MCVLGREEEEINASEPAIEPDTSDEEEEIIVVEVIIKFVDYQGRYFHRACYRRYTGLEPEFEFTNIYSMRIEMFEKFFEDQDSEENSMVKKCCYCAQNCYEIKLHEF